MIIDTTVHADRLRVVTATRRYCRRAIPLAWGCGPGQTEPVGTMTRRGGAGGAGLLADVRMVIRAERAFGCPVLTDQAAVHGRAWLMRVRVQTHWQDRRGGIHPIRIQVSQRGERWNGAGPAVSKAG